MAANFLHESEVPSLVITHRKVRRSRCMCLLFLFLLATFVGLAPIMVYRSLGVPLPEGLRGYRNVQPWVILSKTNPVEESPAPLDGAEVQAPLAAQQQSTEESVKPQSISIPRVHLHRPKPTQTPTSIPSLDPPQAIP